MSDVYKLSAAETLKQLETSLEFGLTQEVAASRLAKHGPNELVERGAKSPWRIFLEQLTSTMVIILIVSAAVSAFLGEYKDVIAILAIVLVNALLGFRQEYQAEQSMAALKKMAVPIVRVRRKGHIQEISARELVPGDILLTEAGNLVPADCRLLESANLRIEEAALTGESVPVDKEAGFVAASDLPLGDRRNMAFMGTVVTYGRGSAVVVKTGMETELGNIATLIQTARQEQTPLQRRLDQLSKGLAFAAFGLVIVVFGLGVFRGEELRLMFLTAMSMAVAAIPESLPAVVTIALALGAQRMLTRRALIRRLPAVEGLGSVTIICSDKTGTLTENRMTVSVLDVAGDKVDLVEDLRRSGKRGLGTPCGKVEQEAVAKVKRNPAMTLLLTGGALANDALFECEEDDYEIIGDPTEGALLVAAARSALEKEQLEVSFSRVAEVPFDSDRKRMTTVHKVNRWEVQGFGVIPNIQTFFPEPAMPEEYIAFTKGAVDSLLQVCDRVLVNNQVEALSDEWRQRIVLSNEGQAQSGLRVLGVAFREWEALPEEQDESHLEVGLIFIGMFSMIDPARPEVKEAGQTCKTAGIRVIMITGDHPLTARYIANELGIGQGESILTGQDLTTKDASELNLEVGRVNVFARVSPENKLQIVQALQDLGEIVAMTGDGVNDAPALNKADIGVSMGITGTDVAKEASDVILLDDNFATIVAAVEEGRRIYDNIRKFIKYTMTSNAGEIWVMLLAPFLGIPFPLEPLQILWINLVTDGLPGLALGVEPAERRIMYRPPYRPNENIFGRSMGRDIIWVGLLMGLVSLGIGYWFRLADLEYMRTMVFTTLTLSQMGNALATRSQRDSLFQIGLLSNRAMLGAVLLTLLLQIAVIYLPFLQTVFGTRSLSLLDLGISLGLSTAVFWAVELAKWFIRRVDVS